MLVLSFFQPVWKNSRKRLSTKKKEFNMMEASQNDWFLWHIKGKMFLYPCNLFICLFWTVWWMSLTTSAPEALATSTSHSPVSLKSHASFCIAHMSSLFFSRLSHFTLSWSNAIFLHSPHSLNPFLIEWWMSCRMLHHRSSNYISAFHLNN